MPLAVSFFSSGTLLGALGPFFLLLAIGFAAWAYARVHISKAQEQAIVTWRQNAEGHEERARMMAEKYETERERRLEVVSELAAEKLKTDQTVVLTEIAAFHKDFANREALFQQIFDTLANQRQEFVTALLEAQKAGVAEIGLLLKESEGRTLAQFEKVTGALEVVAARLNGH